MALAGHMNHDDPFRVFISVPARTCQSRSDTEGLPWGMAVDTGRSEAPAGMARERDRRPRAVSRRLYLPTVAVAGLAAWLGWRGWTELAESGPGLIRGRWKRLWLLTYSERCRAP